MMTAKRAATVRTGPEFDIVGTLLVGDKAQVTGEVRGRDWLRVASPARRGLGLDLRAAPRTAVLLVLSGASWSIAANHTCAEWNYGN